MNPTQTTTKKSSMTRPKSPDSLYGMFPESNTSMLPEHHTYTVMQYLRTESQKKGALIQAPFFVSGMRPLKAQISQKRINSALIENSLCRAVL